MEPKIIFDVATKPFDWQPITVCSAICAGGALALLSRRFKWLGTGAKNIGYVLIGFAVVTASFILIHWDASRFAAMRALASGRYEVVRGTVEHLQPMYYGGRKQESFSVSGHTFNYSDNEVTPCFNSTLAHGGPIREGMIIEISFTNECILRIERIRVTPDWMTLSAPLSE